MSVADASGGAGDLRAPAPWLFAQPLRPASFYAPVWTDGPTRTGANSANPHDISCRTAEGAAYIAARRTAGSDVMFMAEDTSLSEIVGHNIHLARKGHPGLSQVRLGERLGVDQREISRWERGVHLPSERYLRKLAVELGKPNYLWFYGEHDE